MSYFQEKLDIEEFFLANWTETPVYFENGEVGVELEWVRLTVLSGRSKQVTMGDNPDFRHHGSVIVQIFTPPDQGSGRAVELADMVHNLFINRVLNGIQFSVPQIRKGPSTAERYQLNVSTDYHRGF